MIRQFYRKQRKLLTGALNTHIKINGQNYNDLEWWDDSFYTKGVSDRLTIFRGKNLVTSKYHYASIEMQILKHLRNNRISVSQARVIDIGSGAGHWIDFYKSLEPLEIVGMDISLLSFNHLKDKYAKDASISIHHGKAIEVLTKLNGNFNFVNAIGVMFHIVDDLEWEDTIYAVGNKMNKGGLFIVGGHFGFIDGLNILIDKDGNIIKRLRSKKRWTNVLKKSGVHKNQPLSE
ncbi:class I SAM-dependent methyltransferase [Pseudomonadota bacterium]